MAATPLAEVLSGFAGAVFEGATARARRLEPLSKVHDTTYLGRSLPTVNCPPEDFQSKSRSSPAVFVDMQFKRHEADYNPDAQFNKDAVVQAIDDAEYQLEQFVEVPPSDRRTFAVHVLMNPRRNWQTSCGVEMAWGRCPHALFFT